MGSERFGATAVLAGGFLAAWGLFAPDGTPAALHLVGAERVLAGELPYRDFWTLYAPGSYYLLAGLFAVFGAHVLVSAAAGAVLSAGAVAVAHRWLLGWVRPLPALGGAAVLGAALLATPYPRSLNTYPPVLLCMVAALLAASRSWRSGSRPALVAAGLACGTGALFKHDVGAYTALALGAGFAAGPGTPRERLGALSRFAAAAALPVAAGLLPVALLAGRDALQDLVLFPATDFRHARPESYPSLLPGVLLEGPERGLARVFEAGSWLRFALPTLVVGLAAGALALRRWRPDPAARALAAAGLAGYALHWNAAHVQINTHVVSMTLYALALCASAWRALAGRRGAAAAGLRAAAVAAAAAWIALPAVEPAYEAWRLWTDPREVLRQPKVSGLFYFPEDARALERLLALVDERVPPGAPIHVGEHRHDMVIVNDTRLYFALDRPSATRYHELHPGVTNTEAVQAEMIRDLESREVPLLVLRHRFPDEDLDRELASQRRALPQTGAVALDRYIRERYAPIERLGMLEVWLRREPGGASPGAGGSEPPAVPAGHP